MIRTPKKGLRYSAKKHNSRIDVLADWIEGSALFEESRVSKTDVLDILSEEGVYSDMDLARAFISDVWKELKYRIKHGRINALNIDANGIEQTDSWENFPAYSFCLALSLREWYSCTDNSYIEQGELFERLTECSLTARGWRLLRTGWSSTNQNNLVELVQKISLHLGHPVGYDVEQRASPKAKDAGLDLVCDQPFLDSRGGSPLYFFQCASGAHWKKKTMTPDLRFWEKLIDFSNSPIRGFAIPYVLSPKDFRYVSNSINGMLLDRLRLFGLPDGVDNWINPELKSDLKAWLTPRLEDFQPQ